MMGIGALELCNEGQHIGHGVSYLHTITPVSFQVLLCCLVWPAKKSKEKN